jgi:Family of unknown function (DUF6464)
VLQIVLILAFFLGFLAVVLQLTQREALRGHRRIATTIESSNRLTYKRIPRDPEEYYIEGVGYIIGDVSCRYNACSPYIRCAVNPSGLCDGCREYQGKNRST